MTIEVRLFASLADAVGQRSLAVEMSADSNVEQLWVELGKLYPALAKSKLRPLVACDMEYADWSDSLQGVKEVAFLPPVSGG